MLQQHSHDLFGECGFDVRNLRVIETIIIHQEVGYTIVLEIPEHTFRKSGNSGTDNSLIADIKPTFSEQGRVNAAVAKELGLKEGTPITYRAGDQPNNALSLNVFNPGEIASTAGTSGVVYGVNGEVNYDPKSRVNTFAHVNHASLEAVKLPGEFNRCERHFSSPSVSKAFCP